MNSAPQTTERRIAETPPANGLGGAIVEGKYFQTEVAYYTGPGGSTASGTTRQQTVTFTATATPGVYTWQVVRLSGSTTLHETYTLTFSADTVTFVRSCPNSSGTTLYHYTVDGDTWTVWIAAVSGSTLGTRETFVRQP